MSENRTTMSKLSQLFKPKKNHISHEVAADPNITAPENVKHEISVKVDPATGKISGLPATWDAWLGTSNIR